MMTGREASQRNALNNVQMRKNGSEYRVTLPEWKGKEAERKAYYTDDLEDAVLTGAAMRRQHERAVA